MVKPPPGFEPGTSRLVRTVLYPLSYGGNRSRRSRSSLLSAWYGTFIWSRTYGTYVQLKNQ
jgi:hypothetical protein